MGDPLVSVLLPVRDGGSLLEGCLRSLQRQTVTDLEVVAVDDGSEDGSGELLDRWAAEDPRYRVLHLPRSGLVPALNAGVEACRAPLVARMDADDVSHPRRLELQLGLLRSRPEVGVVSCLVRHVPWQRVAEGFRLYEAWLNSLTTHDRMARERFVESPLAHPSALLRRRLLLEVGGYRDRGWPEDYDLWLRLFGAGVRFAKIQRLLYFWRERPDRLSRVGTAYTTDAFLRCKAHFLVAGPLAGTSRVVVWGAGQTGRRLSRHLLEAGGSVEAFVDIDPLKIGRTVRDRPVLAPEDLGSRLGTGTVVLAAVASRGARDLIRSRVDALGLTEGESFWCVA
jgi:glycosyltransferase involved in cell wall biosynthesis